MSLACQRSRGKTIELNLMRFGFVQSAELNCRYSKEGRAGWDPAVGQVKGEGICWKIKYWTKVQPRWPEKKFSFPF